MKIITERFSEIPKYIDLIKDIQKRSIKIPKWQAQYPKDIYSENLFGIYNVQYTEGDKVKSISLDSTEQLQLLKFLNIDLDISGITIQLPMNKDDCFSILKILQNQYESNIAIIKNLIKSFRSKADPNMIFRDIIFKKKV